MRRLPTLGTSLVGLIVALTLASAACSNSSAPTATSSAPTTSPTGISSAPATSGGTGSTLEQGAGGALVFAPTTLTVNEGSTITVKNVGSVPHTFTISGKGIDVVNNPGQSQSVTIDLPAGTYEFICRFHVSSGMKGTLIVK